MGGVSPGEMLWSRGGLGRTTEQVSLEELGAADPERTQYMPSGWLTLRRALPRRAVKPTDVFVDIGSGKGRIVYQAAARYRFARVVGVEVSEELNAVAREIIDSNWKNLRCQEIELVTCDATKFEIPEDMTVVFMFNPFSGRIFRLVLANIIRSLDRHPRELTFIYANPVMEDAVRETGRFREVRRYRRPIYDVIVFTGA